MHEISNQTYLGTPNENAEIDSQHEGGSLSFFLDGNPINQSSFQFQLPNAGGGQRVLEAVYIAPIGNKAGIRVRAVTNRPNGQDVTIMVVTSNSNHASTFLNFQATGDASFESFLANTKPAKSKKKKSASKKRSARK